MKFTEEDINNFVEIMAAAESLRPLVHQASDVIKSYGSELAMLVDALVNYTIKRNTNTFNQYCSNGFSREEALLLVLNSKAALQDALNNRKGAK
jgi:hypothetical protein